MSEALDQALERLNAHKLEFIDMMGGRAVALDDAARSCTFEWNIPHAFCHSGDIVQGGFVSAMLDATMSHAVFGLQREFDSLATLEMKVSFFEPTRAGKLRSIGAIVRGGRRTAFLEGELFDPAGSLLAKATATARLIRAK